MTQLVYRVAMRMRFGLPLRPAFSVEPERRCAHVTRAGQRCPKRLDRRGHHAAACGKGGGWVSRHNAIVRALAAELRRMGFDVRTEVWVDDLMEQTKDGLREARMDLVLQSAAGTIYVDVVCFHPFTGKGARRTAASGGTTEAQEQRKRRRYPVADPVTRRRSTLALFYPVAVTTYGAIGDAAARLFALLEAEAQQSRPEHHRPRGWLQRVAEQAGVFGTARGVISGYTAPDGQERAHLHGRAAS